MAETQLGPFVVERELGRGGMGVVYAARLAAEGAEGRRVALKVSLADVPERDRKHFLAEAELVARVSHPSVIGILGSGTLDDGRPYLVMPLLEGETLADRLARERLPQDLALRLFAQLASAVAALHDAGIVHRDIKPENVMVLRGEPRVVLLDFGIARDVDGPASTTTQMNVVRGTPGCMAPERFFGVRASASSDVYELAVVLYAMLVGRLPWDDPTDPESRLRPRHPTEVGVELPVGLGHVLLEALSTRPDKRPSVRELAARVSPALAATPAVQNPRRDTALATLGTPATPATPALAPRARSVAPPSSGDGEASWRARVVWFVAAAVLVSVAVGGSLRVRARPRVASAAVAGIAATTRTASERLASAAPGGGDPRTPPGDHAIASADPAPSAAPSAAARAPAAPPADPSGATAASSAPAAAKALVPWCARLAEAYCSPVARKMPYGEERCLQRRAEAARMANLPDTTRARTEAQCREAIPALEQSLRTPQPSEVAEDLPFCKRVVATYCSPEVRNSYGGDSLCAQAQNAWGARLMSLPVPQRAVQNEQCARLLPAAIAAMKQHVRDMGPGTAASARASGAPPPGAPGAGP